MKRKIIALISAFALILSIAACGTPENSDFSEPSDDSGADSLISSVSVSADDYEQILEILESNLPGGDTMKRKIATTLAAIALTASITACDVPGGGENSDIPVSGTGSGNVSVSVTASAADYDQIYEMIKAKQAESQDYGRMRNSAILAEGLTGGVDMEMAVADNAVPAPTAPAGGSAERDESPSEAMNYGQNPGSGGSEDGGYSGTNNQVQGVQESDIVKTDGKNIYAISRYYNSVVNVIGVNNGVMTKMATLEMQDAYPIELLLYGDKLIVIWSKSTYIPYEPPTNQDSEGNDIVPYGYYGYWWGWHDYETIVEVYSTNGNFRNPASTFSQKGWYSSSRMIDNNIYLITSYSPYVNYMHDFAREDLDCYIPSFEVNGDRAFVLPNRIILPETLDNVQYTVISGLDVNRADLLVSATADLGSSYIIYSSLDNIFITSYAHEIIGQQVTPWGTWDEYKEFTKINKFSINKGQVNFTASGKVEGSVQNQFWLDEHNGTLRVVSQIWEWGRNWDNFRVEAYLYTLDENLNQLDVFKGIGEGENVQSVRAEGDIIYIVTFMTTDPLYSFDVSNPRNIIMLDELKIPGFSRYMHRWADGLLLGIGVDADETDGMRTGLKLSMFDTSDNESLFERHVFTIPMPEVSQNNNSRWWSWSWIWSPAEHSHKSILISPERNIIGFPYSYYAYDSNSYYNYNYEGNMYVLFSYDKDEGFTMTGEISMPQTDGWWSNGFERGLFIGDYLYAIGDNMIISARLSDMEAVQALNLI